jgi:UDP-N-acetylglucosamine 2-epimerase (non-hydrolysing)
MAREVLRRTVESSLNTMKPKKLICVGGARPNFMKLAPIMRALEQPPEFDPVLVHTGQHYDQAMSGQFFRELGLPCPSRLSTSR